MISGCAPVGVADRAVIPDSSFLASTFYDSRYAVHTARLRSKLYGWGPKAADKGTDWLRVDLGEEFKLCAIATQGCSGNQEWTTKYTLELSKDGVSWKFYQENGKTKVASDWGNYRFSLGVGDKCFPELMRCSHNLAFA